MKAKRKPRRFIFVLVFFVVIGALMAYSVVAKHNFGVGRTIQELGVDKAEYREDFEVSPRCYAPVVDFLSKKKQTGAHFTGTLILSRPNTSLDRFELYIDNGKLRSTRDASWKYDRYLKMDLQVLAKLHLGAMIANTSNDWRVETESGHYTSYISPYTGKISVYPSKVFGWYATYDVRHDVIVASERRLGFYLD